MDTISLCGIFLELVIIGEERCASLENESYQSSEFSEIHPCMNEAYQGIKLIRVAF